MTDGKNSPDQSRQVDVTEKDLPLHCPLPGAPLWSRAEGYHELEEQADGTTVLTFHETYHAYNPVLRFLLERPVHAKISRDNLDTYQHALGFAGTVTRLT